MVAIDDQGWGTAIGGPIDPKPISSPVRDASAVEGADESCVVVLGGADGSVVLGASELSVVWGAGSTTGSVVSTSGLVVADGSGSLTGVCTVESAPGRVAKTIPPIMSTAAAAAPRSHPRRVGRLAASGVVVGVTTGRPFHSSVSRRRSSDSKPDRGDRSMGSFCRISFQFSLMMRSPFLLRCVWRVAAATRSLARSNREGRRPRRPADRRRSERSAQLVRGR